MSVQLKGFELETAPPVQLVGFELEYCCPVQFIGFELEVDLGPVNSTGPMFTTATLPPSGVAPGIVSAGWRDE